MRGEEDEYRVHFEARSGQVPADLRQRSAGARPVADTPFCLGILGNFSGVGRRAADGERRDLSARPLRRVTPDNVLQFAGLEPRARIATAEGAAAEEVRLSSFDDFHPRRLFQRLSSFESARRARRQLVEEPDPGNAPEGRREAAAARPDGGSEPDPAPDLLDAVLEATGEERAPAGGKEMEDLDAFIHRVVRPHVVTGGAERSEELVQLDRQIVRALNGAIHDPDFQALEALWRSVVFLLSRVQVGSKLRVYLVDVSGPELRSDLLATDDPTKWSLGRLFFDPVSPNGEAIRWAGLIGNYTFGRQTDDVPLLQRIGLLAEAAEVPFFSAADPVLIGARSGASAPVAGGRRDPEDARWNRLRTHTEAMWITLAWPEFLLRPPYGRGSKTEGDIEFAETPAGPDDLLWGNPAILCGIELARAFDRSGWDLRPSRSFRVDNVPLHAVDGTAGPLRTTLSVSATAELRAAGFTPVVCVENEAALVVRGLRSISVREGDVRGWWVGGR